MVVCPFFRRKNGVANKVGSMASVASDLYGVRQKPSMGFRHKAPKVRRHKGQKVRRHKAVADCAAIKCHKKL